MRSREQRDRLLRAGEQIFAAQGFTSAHVADIAAAADCSVGSFYRRFEDKEALFLALQHDMYERSASNLKAFFANPLCRTESVTTVFFQFVRNGAREKARLKGYFRALFEISLAGKDVWAQMRSLEREAAAGFEGLLADRGIARRTDFINAVSMSVRMIAGHQISLILHGPGPYSAGDGAGASEMTRTLMCAAGLEADEIDLARLAGKPSRAF
jgi:AcrR family transcriptional regulator